MLAPNHSPRGPVTTIAPWPLWRSSCQPSGTEMLAELAGAVTVCSFGTFPECPAARVGCAAEAEGELLVAGALVIPPAGCHTVKSLVSMGLIELPKLLAKSESNAASETAGRRNHIETESPEEIVRDAASG